MSSKIGTVRKKTVQLKRRPQVALEKALAAGDYRPDLQHVHHHHGDMIAADGFRMHRVRGAGEDRCPCPDCAFPDFSYVYPARYDYSALVSAEEAKRAVAAAAAFAKTGDHSNRNVYLNCNGSIQVEGRDEQTGKTVWNVTAASEGRDVTAVLDVDFLTDALHHAAPKAEGMITIHVSDCSPYAIVLIESEDGQRDALVMGKDMTRA